MIFTSFIVTLYNICYTYFEKECSRCYICWMVNKNEILRFCKKVRKQLNYTQKELADAIDVSYATVNRWENSQVLPSKLAVKSFLDFCIVTVNVLNSYEK